MRLQEKTGKTNQFFITVPKNLVLALKWKKGERIRYEINRQGNLEMVRE